MIVTGKKIKWTFGDSNDLITSIEFPKIIVESIAQWRMRSAWMQRCPRSIPGRG